MAVIKYNSATDVVETSAAKPSGSVSSGSVTRVSVIADDPNMVTIAGVRTTKAAATAAGLWSPQQEAALAAQPSADAKNAMALAAAVARQDAAKTAEANKANELALSSDRMIDAIEADIGRDQLGAWTEEVINNAGEALDKVPDTIFNAYYSRAETIARGVGLENLDAMSALLDDDQQAAARRAIVTNDVGAFQRAVQETIREATKLGESTEFHGWLRESGIQVRDQSINIEGQWIPIKTAILNGWISTDEDDE
jgi:hypothetical protein